MSRSSRFRIAVRRFGPFESAIARQWASFEAAAGTGLDLDAVALDLHPLHESLFEKEGLKSGEWDVAFAVTDWVAEAHSSGALADLAGLIGTDPPPGYPDAWTPSLLRLQQIGGQMLGLPYHDGPECLIYRKDLFEDPAEQAAYERAFGAPLRVPETWDEFQRTARFFTRPEQGLYGTVFAAYPDGHNTVYDFCLQLWTRGGELFAPDGRPLPDTEAAADALDYYRRMVNDRSAVHPKGREFDSVKSGLAFSAGEVAMMVNWFGFGAMAETIEASRVRGKVSIAEIPHAPGCAGASLNIYWILSIASGSPHRDVAWRFLRHCASAEMDKLLTLEGAIGCRKSSWSDPDVNAVVPFYSRLADLHANAREMPRLAEWPQVAAAIDEMVIGAIDTGAPVEELLRKARRRIGGRATLVLRTAP
jgi:multiple sugar transport system substrate-binding protein